MTRMTILTTTLVLLAAAAGAVAENVDLVTLPTRDSVQLTIYNSEDLTLVKETRQVTLTKGVNRLQFSWANTLIDPTSVQFRPLEHAGQIEVLDTVFPGRKPQQLFWRIHSDYAGQAAVEVSYFTSGLTWTMDYVAITDPAERSIRFDGRVRVFNRSGEDYDNAEVRLIVGKINLVEKIAELARAAGRPVPAPESEPYRKSRREAVAVMMDAAGARMGSLPQAPKEIITEGLSEYFMFTVEGTETIPDGWSKRMPAVNADDVSFDIVYRYRPHHYGPKPVRLFIWSNDADHGLGDSPLPDGRVRLFRRNGRDGLTFLGEKQIDYAPIASEIEINTGPDDLVVLTSRTMEVKRSNFTFDHGPHRPRDEYVVGWDETQRLIDTIRNYRDKPIAVQWRRQWPGDAEVDSEAALTTIDYRTVEATLEVPARDTTELPLTVTIHHGKNSERGVNRVRVKP